MHALMELVSMFLARLVAWKGRFTARSPSVSLACKLTGRRAACGASLWVPSHVVLAGFPDGRNPRDSLHRFWQGGLSIGVIFPLQDIKMAIGTIKTGFR